MRYAKELFIAALIVGLFLVIWDGQRQRKKLSELSKRDTVLKAQMDSLVVLQRQADLVAIEALTRANLSEQREKQLLAQAKTRDAKHETFIRRPLIRLSDAGIDSAVNRLIARSQH